MAGQRRATQERMDEQERVLLVQDTTSFNYSHHPATAGLGGLENEWSRGFLAHTTLAVSLSGVPLGVLEQQVWVRDDAERGKREQRHERAFADKESYKWVEGLPRLGLDGRRGITVADAEAHVYDFLDDALEREIDFVVRATQGRSLTVEGQTLFAAVADQEVQQRYALTLKRQPDRDPRQAEVELRFGSVSLNRPRRADTERPALALWVVDVYEPRPPAGEAAVHWLLLTSLPVASVAQAQQVVTFYTYRWLVERFHFVLKSGCRLEASQLRQEIRLERLLAIYSLVAYKLLWLTYQARLTPDASCSVALLPGEWQALYAFIHPTQHLPALPPSLRQATRWIAQLGGFIARKGDGDPGVKVLWRGWSRLQDIVQTWSISHPTPLHQDVGNV